MKPSRRRNCRWVCHEEGCDFAMDSYNEMVEHNCGTEKKEDKQ